MRGPVLLIAAAMLLCAALAVAQVCPSPAPGDYPNHRPQGEQPNYPPASEPVCLYYTTSGGQP